MASIIKADTLQSTTSNVFVLNSAGTEYARFDSSGIFQLANPTTFPAGTAALPSITTAGDTNTGLYFPAADTIAFATAGTEDMRIDSVGNVMIGTTTSQTGAKLSVTGGIQGTITSGTAVSPTSSTSIDYTSLPSWVKKITVTFQGLSSSSSSLWLLQLGTSSGVTTSGYLGRVAGISGSAFSAYSAGFTLLTDSSNGAILHGLIQIVTLGSNNFAMNGILGRSDGGNVYISGGSIALAGTLDRIRITTVNGSDTFDAGSINILYEG
jgi:hypothetical protein